MAQEQKESIDRTFAQFMQPDLGFRTGVDGMAERIEQASKGKCQKQRIANGEKFNSYWDEIIFLFMKGRQFE